MMNRKSFYKGFILSTAFGLIVFRLHAQDYTRPANMPVPVSNDKKFSLGFSIGPAIPLLDFGSSNVKGSFWDASSNDSTRLQGFAKTGFHFNVTASYLITDNFGMMLMLGTSSNPFDINTFSAVVGYPATSTSGNYSVNEYLIGPYLNFNVNPKLNFKLDAMIGLVNISYPEITLPYNDTINETLDFQGGLNFGYSFGAALEYNITPSVGISLNVSYTGANITYGSWTLTYTASGYYPLQYSHPTDETNMTTGLLKETIGLFFKL